MRFVTRVAVFTLVLGLLQALPAIAAPPDGRGADMERFIVVLEDGVEPRGLARQAAAATGGQVGFVYEHAINGFYIEMPAAALNGLRNFPGVAFIEPDVEVQIAAQTESTGWDRIDADLHPGGADYEAIDIAILDTGVWYDTQAGVSHEDLRLRYVTDCTGAIFYPMFGGCTGGGVDGHGHGTHVAGIAAACDNGIGSRGVAPCATVWSFKVLGDDGTGYLGSIIAGVDLVAERADRIEVANMSLGFIGESAALDDAIKTAVANGVVFVVAAGNDTMDVSTFMPAAVESAITVSSIDDFDGVAGGLAQPTCRPGADDQLAPYSNFGAGVDIAAPGSCIYSTDLGNTYSMKSGTSMAAPTVAGAAARYLHDNAIDPTSASDVYAVRDALVNGGMAQNGPCGFGGDTDGFAEPLLFMNGTAFGGDGSCEGGVAPPSNPPTAVIDAPSCNELVCDFVGSNSTDDTGIDSYLWDFGDGNSAETADASHTYATAGTYTVSLTVTDDDGQQDTATVEVSPALANQAPTAVISQADCTDLDCTFDASGSSDDSAIVSYSWDFGDGVGSGSGVTPAYSYGSGGSYTVTLTVEDAEGLTDTDSVVINPTDPPVNSPATAVISQADCIDLDCQFDGSTSSDDSGIASYAWDFGDGNTSSAASPAHTYAAAGTYTVSLTVTANDGDTDSTSVSVTVTEPPGEQFMTIGVAGFLYDGTWATVEFLVTDMALNGVAGAQVTGEWHYTDRRGRPKVKTVSGVADATGFVTITTRFKNNPPDLFCATGATADGYVYRSSGEECGGLIE